MPPPISMASATFIKFSTTSILSETLAPPSTATNGRAGLESALAEIGEFALHQKARGSLADEPRDAYYRSMSTVRRSKSVANKQPVAERGKLPRKAFVVGFFFRMKANILEQKHAAIGERAALGLRLGTDAIRGKFHRRSHEFRKFGRRRPQAVFRIGFAFGAAQVRGQHQTRAAFARQLQSRQGLANARVVGDASAFERHVEINANEYALPPKIEVANGKLVHRGLIANFSGMRLQTRGHELDQIATRGRNSPTHCRTTPEPWRSSTATTRV